MNFSRPDFGPYNEFYQGEFFWGKTPQQKERVKEYVERARAEAAEIVRTLGLCGIDMTMFMIEKREEARQLALLNLPYLSPTFPT
jgi:hypothetical protein